MVWGQVNVVVNWAEISNALTLNIIERPDVARAVLQKLLEHLREAKNYSNFKTKKVLFTTIICLRAGF